MQVFLKYCGGCNPRYDRLSIAFKLGEDFPGLALSAQDSSFPDFALIVCGCDVKCVEICELNGKYGNYVIASLKDYPNLRDTFCRLINKERSYGFETDI